MIRQCKLCHFVKDIAQALVKGQREEEQFVVVCVNRAAQERGRTLKIGFELFLCDAVIHYEFPVTTN